MTSASSPTSTAKKTSHPAPDQLVRLSGADATFVASTLMPADEVVFFEFRAVDGAAVLELAGRAGLPCDRLVAAERSVIDQ